MPVRALVKKLPLLILAPVVFFGLLEVVLRIAGFTYDPVAEGSVETPHGAWSDVEHYRQDPELLWTLKPSVRFDNPGIGLVQVRTNSAGLRGPELPGPKEPNELRVVCLGDSIVFGLALPEDQAFPVQLQGMLESGPLGRNRRVRVISLAVPGWSALQGRRALERFAALDPDVVVFWFGMNDAQPARVLPDERLGSADRTVEETTGALRTLRSFQLVQYLVHGAMGGRERPRRVPTELFGRIVAELREREREGGPLTLFIRCPNTLDTAIAQTRRVIERAEQEGVERVYGPYLLLTPLRIAPPGQDLIGKRRSVDGSEALVFDGEVVDAEAELPVLKENQEFLVEMRRALQANLATLPGDSLSPEEVFGTEPRYEFFIDACHLSALGAKRAGEGIARAIEARLAR